MKTKLNLTDLIVIRTEALQTDIVDFFVKKQQHK